MIIRQLLRNKKNKIVYIKTKKKGKTKTTTTYSFNKGLKKKSYRDKQSRTAEIKQQK